MTRVKTAKDDARAMAQAVVNTHFYPPGLMKLMQLCDEADAYHKLQPYPRFALASWKTEDRGPLPVCMPIAKEITRRSAKWLFGKPIQIKASGNPKLQERLRKAWTANGMQSRIVAAAERGGRHGGYFLKYSIDETADEPISIQTLSLMDEVRLFYHPHDRNRLLMARIQYRFYDAANGQYWWYREEWTDEQEIHYKSIHDDLFRGSPKLNPDTYDAWEIESQEPNIFGRIPGAHIRNLETDDIYGAADLWDLFNENKMYRVLDKINIAFWLMDVSNQYDAQINPIILDGDVEEQDLDKPLLPGQPWQIDTKPDSKYAARVMFPTGQNQLRPAMMEYVKEIRRLLYAAASSVEFSPENITNKGALTQAVLALIFQPQIELTDEKRKCQGENGLEVFFENLARGAQQAGLELGVKDDPDTWNVEIGWNRYFVLTEDEKTSTVARVRQEEQAGYMPHDRAIDMVAHIEDIDDTEALKQELAKEPPPAPEGVPDPDEQPDLPGGKPVLSRPI